MIKALFSQTSKGLLLLSLAGCSKTLTNVTPQIAQRNPSNMYRFTTRCNVDPAKVIPGSFLLDLIIDGERHQSVEQAYQAYDWIREVGFKNVNLDLIFPPDFSAIEQWKQDLITAVHLAPEHLSTYCLTYENDTGPFTPEHHKAVDENKEADFYEFTWKFLADQGYEHYEVSNFSKPGFQCLHNMNTWRMQEWIGWGPSAASQYAMRRFQNPFDMKAWIHGQRINEATLTDDMLYKDCLIFGLRTCEGVDLDQLQQRFPKFSPTSYAQLWKTLTQAGLLTLSDHHLRCTPKGLLLADSIALEILAEDIEA